MTRSQVLKFTALSLAASLSVACAPTPDRVCDRMVEIRAEGRFVSPERRAIWRVQCVGAMTRARSSDSATYRSVARCVLGLTGPTRRFAMDGCILPVRSYFSSASAVGTGGLGEDGPAPSSFGTPNPYAAPNPYGARVDRMRRSDLDPNCARIGAPPVAYRAMGPASRASAIMQGCRPGLNMFGRPDPDIFCCPF